jgi:hypothetical protein
MDEDEEVQQSSVDNYTGVAIKVGVVFGPLILRGIHGILRIGVV